MRRLLLIVVLGAMGFMPLAYRPDRDGAEADIGITVVDINGKPVAGACARFKFYTTLEDYYFIESKTDAAGRATVKGKTRGEVVVGVGKDDFYFTIQKLEYRKIAWDEAVSSRKWSKETVENKVVLKPVLSPLRMPVHSASFKKPPVTGEPMPYDILAADWCAPYGKGKIKDIEINFFKENTTNYVAYTGMRMLFPNCVDGLYAAKADEWCNYRYQYCAETNAIYSKCFEMGECHVHSQDALVQSGHDQSIYHVVRFRTMTNKVGRIVSARYGLIFGGLDYSGGLSMGVQVNPNENDTNLESDWAVRNMRREKHLR